jgi:hypothetical protein
MFIISLKSTKKNIITMEQTMITPTALPKLVACYQTEDSEDDEFFYEYFLNDVTGILKKMKTSKFLAFSKKLTWRNVAGYRHFEATTAEDFIQKIAPNTSEVTIKVYKNLDHKNTYDFVMYHHDAPTGQTLTIMSEYKAKKLKILEKL